MQVILYKPTDHSLSSSLGWFWPLFGLTALGLILRLINLDVSFWYDEGFTGYLSKLTSGQLFRFLSQENIHPSPPLYFLVVGTWAEVFHTDLGIRYFSVFAGVTSIPIFFSLCTKMFNHRVAWIASGLLVVSPFHILYSQEARLYALYILLAIAALWFLVTALQSPRPWNLWWVAYALTGALILYTHGSAPLIFMGLAAFHFCLIWPTDRLRLYQWIGVYLLAFLLYLPWLSIELHHLKVVKLYHLSWVPPVSLRSILSAMRGYIYYPPYKGAGALVSILWILPHLVLLSLAVLSLVTSSRKKVVALVVFAAVPVITVSVYGYLVQPLFIARWLAPVVVPLLIIAALPMDLFRKRRWRIMICLITASALMLSFGSSISYLRARKVQSWREAALKIRQNIDGNDAILALPKGAEYVFNWYFQEGKDNHPVISMDDEGDLDSYCTNYFGDHGRLWIVRDSIVGAPETRKVLKWFGQKYSMQRDTSFPLLDVFIVRPKDQNKVQTGYGGTD